MPIDWVQKTAELREKIKKNRESERNKAMKKTWAGSPEERNGDYCIRGRIKLGEIIVDAYQRGTPTRKEVGDLVKVWNERGAANVILSLRDDDPQYYCIDGQRRVAAAREIHGRDGDIEALVWLGLTAQEEAELFELYQRRKDLTPLDVFHSKLFREEPEAVVVNAIITNLGLRFGHPVDGDMSRIAAVGAVIQAYQKYGVTEVRELLRLLRDGFRQFTVPKANSISRMAIGGMGQFLARYPNCDRERVVEILGRLGPDMMVSRCRGIQQLLPNVEVGSAWGRALHSEYNKGLRTQHLEDWTERVYGSEAFKQAVAKRKTG